MADRERLHFSLPPNWAFLVLALFLFSLAIALVTLFCCYCCFSCLFSLSLSFPSLLSLSLCFSPSPFISPLVSLSSCLSLLPMFFILSFFSRSFPPSLYIRYIYISLIFLSPLPFSVSLYMFFTSNSLPSSFSYEPSLPPFHPTFIISPQLSLIPPFSLSLLLFPPLPFFSCSFSCFHLTVSIPYSITPPPPTSHSHALSYSNP